VNSPLLLTLETFEGHDGIALAIRGDQVVIARTQTRLSHLCEGDRLAREVGNEKIYADTTTYHTGHLATVATCLKARVRIGYQNRISPPGEGLLGKNSLTHVGLWIRGTSPCGEGLTREVGLVPLPLVGEGAVHVSAVTIHDLPITVSSRFLC
jgi:hypothetical protein